MLKTRSKATALATAAVLVWAGTALVDNVQNDVDAVVGRDTITEGGSTTVSFRIAENNGDGLSGCNAADGSDAVVTINAPAAVTATPGNPYVLEL